MARATVARFPICRRRCRTPPKIVSFSQNSGTLDQEYVVYGDMSWMRIDRILVNSDSISCCSASLAKHSSKRSDEDDFRHLKFPVTQCSIFQKSNVVLSQG
jgi:hypothetical protein